MKTQISIEGLHKRVGASQRDFVITQNNRVTIRKPWKSLATVAFGLFLSVPGLTQAQYSFKTIDVPNATATLANGNSTNAIAGQFDDAHGTHGFVRDINGVFTTINEPDAAGFTAINGINSSAQLAGTYNDAGGTPHAFFKNNGNFKTLVPPGSIRSQGGFINTQGQVVGTYRDENNKRHGFIWLPGRFTTFNVPGDDPVLGTVAFGINDFGEVVGNYVAAGDVKPNGSATHRHGFLRSSDGTSFTTFDVPNAIITIGEGINNNGTIVGVYTLTDGKLHGFVLNNGVFTNPVDVPDSNGKAQQTEINSINLNGEIVGFYNDFKGVAHGFRGVPTP
jgi:probable HAF family extracellular repeat protein